VADGGVVAHVVGDYHGDGFAVRGSHCDDVVVIECCNLKKRRRRDTEKRFLYYRVRFLSCLHLRILAGICAFTAAVTCYCNKIY
jgi:hypothetical protein